MKNCGFTLVQLLVVVGLIAVCAALTVPSMAASRVANNERNASTVLKTMCGAEADFRANDRDGNGVADFWTADVKGLYTMSHADVRGPDAPIRLIELSVAGADADGTHVPAGGENMRLETFTRRDPCNGYWFVALTRDHSVPGEDGVYKRDTGGRPPMGRCHNESKFGFVALPDSPRSGRTRIWINENNSLFWSSPELPPMPGQSIPATLGEDIVPSLDWPADDTLRQCFSRR